MSNCEDCNDLGWVTLNARDDFIVETQRCDSCCVFNSDQGRGRRYQHQHQLMSPVGYWSKHLSWVSWKT